MRLSQGRQWVVIACVLALVACDGAVGTEGLTEPLRVQGGQYVLGDLPDASPDGPSITSFEALTGRVRYAMRGKFISGRTTPEAYSVALWLDGAMDGFWIVPAGAPSPADNNERSFSFLMDFSGSLPPGRYDLRMAAFNVDGLRGESRRFGICVAPPWPDNANACDASQRPPLVVSSLEWNTDANVDLVVVGPDGRIAGGRTRTTALSTEGITVNNVPENIGRIDVDAGASCRRDGLRRENLVFPERPARGEYRVFARLTSPCGVDATTVRATLLQRRELPEGQYALESVRQDVTVLRREHADPEGLGTFLFSLQF